MPEAEHTPATGSQGDPESPPPTPDRHPGAARAPERAAHRTRVLNAIGAAVVAAFAATLCIRSLNLADEGAIISQSYGLMQGRMLYKDMESFVTPGIWFLVAATFKAFGASVLHSRIPVFFGYLAMLWLSYRMVRRTAGVRSAWVAVGLMMASTLWAFPAWTFAFYSPFSILFAIAAMDRLLAWERTRRPAQIFYCGLALGLSIAFKQNYGTFALVGTVIAVMGLRFLGRDDAPFTLRSLTSDIGRLAGGVAIVPLAFLAYFAANDSLYPLYQGLVLHPLEFAQKHDIPYLRLSRLFYAKVFEGAEHLTYGSFILNQTRHPFSYGFPPLQALGRLLVVERLHVLLYWAPVATFAGGALLLLRSGRRGRRRDGPLLAMLVVSAFVYLGVFPRADYNHVMNVFQPVVITAVVVAQRFFERNPAPHSNRLRVAMAFAGAVLTLYVYSAAAWYAGLLDAMDTKVDLPRAGVLASAIDASMIEFEVNTIRSMTDEGEPVLTLPSLSMLNFLADRPVPTRYYNTWAHDVGHDEGAGVVEDLETQDVGLVVSSYDNFFSDTVGMREYAPVLAGHLRTHFETKTIIADQKVAFMTRRPEPVVEHAPLRFLDSCDFSEGPWPENFVREHLLFPSVYQVHFRAPTSTSVVTRCQVQLPERAELIVSTGYRRPQAVNRGSKLYIDVLVRGSEGLERVWADTIPVQAAHGWSSPPFPERRIDLSRFGGQEVKLIMRSIFRGQAMMPPLDLIGFAMVWQDPRIESRE